LFARCGQLTWNALSICWLSCTGKYKNARYNYQEAVSMFIAPICLSTKHSFHPTIHPSILPSVHCCVHLFAHNSHPSVFQDPIINDKIKGSYFFLALQTWSRRTVSHNLESSLQWIFHIRHQHVKGTKKEQVGTPTTQRRTTIQYASTDFLSYEMQWYVVLVLPCLKPPFKRVC
jgi:hypothetical protein